MSGPEDPNVLRKHLAEQCSRHILAADPAAKGIRLDWRERVKVLRPVDLAERRNSRGGNHPEGVPRRRQGGLRGRDRRRLPRGRRAAAHHVSRAGGRSEATSSTASATGRSGAPPRQSLDSAAPGRLGLRDGFEDDIVWRRDRKRTITVHAIRRAALPSGARSARPAQIEALELGHRLRDRVGRRVRELRQRPGRAGRQRFRSSCWLMFLIVVALFNSVRQPTMIFLCVPLALIGVTGGLLLTGQPFGFMALLGFLSLIGHADQERDRADRRDRAAKARGQVRIPGHHGFRRQPSAASGDGCSGPRHSA